MERNVMQEFSLDMISEWKPQVQPVDLTEPMGRPVVAYVREITSLQNDNFENSLKGKIGSENYRARYLALCLCDKEGNLIAKNKAGDLGRFSTACLKLLFNAATALNGYTDDDVADMEKNCEETETEGSASS
jgi:hypothetical protein